MRLSWVWDVLVCAARPIEAIFSVVTAKLWPGTQTLDIWPNGERPAKGALIDFCFGIMSCGAIATRELILENCMGFMSFGSFRHFILFERDKKCHEISAMHTLQVVSKAIVRKNDPVPVLDDLRKHAEIVQKTNQFKTYKTRKLEIIWRPAYNFLILQALSRHIRLPFLYPYAVLAAR